MASMSDYLEEALRDHVLRNIAYTSPTDVYMSLVTVVWADDGTGTEVVGGSYARKVLAFIAGGGAGDATTSAALTWLNMPACTVVGAGIHDAVAAGNLLLHAPLPSPKVVAAGQTFEFTAGDVDAVFA